MLSLPAEIREEILDVVLCSDLDHVLTRSMSLVCRTFASSCQRRVFRVIHLSPRGRRSWVHNLNCLRSILQANPRLLEYTRELCIAQHSDPWIVENSELLIDLLDLFCSESSPIHTLCFLLDKQIVWWELEGDLRQAFLNIFALPRLRNLSYSGLYLPYGFLSQFPHLNSLTLVAASSPSGIDRQIDPEAPSQPQRISQLRIICPGPISGRIALNEIGPQLGVDITQLRYLEIHISCPLHWFTRFFRLSRLPELKVSIISYATTQNIHLIYPPWPSYPNSRYALSTSPTLETI
ncbi:hypothetical protein BDN72DRAFT_330008 [Pluteus cervinus]|uniref:Uncharacterized protein n=1 Tax=Pluteus cervinus TaxID=181527 RepID=A0ACD3ACA3_9AGAR|nr:hypothetical protein BDN72DRAFT_330008 [Pluteus cervinus]